MNEMIQALIDADLQARKILEEAQDYLKRTYDTIDEEKARFIENYKAKALGRIAQVKEQSGEAHGEMMRSIEGKYKALFDKLEKTYEENHVRWENELFLKCIKG